ncbi:hypothetical protein [Bradyrhizobium sp. Bra64]|uniref:ORC-CDC6 family AAA ATPase n=1 Tax=Bradyrhizobium sp. Bra64 TaxID=2926009 RepID=UPI002117FC5B|nr:hypothetical protein [Bradyrhizobium sp. Bra64]
MAYRANPFLERMSERTTSDQEFVHLFSPKVLEKLEEDCLEGAVHVFRSPPGGGKTTILRAFTPNALRAFWHARPTQAESYRQLIEWGVLDEERGPQLLGVYLSCAAGYADIPPGVSSVKEGMFRALLDTRIVLRTLRSLPDLIEGVAGDVLQDIRLEYQHSAIELSSIPLHGTALEMIAWAEQREREIYSLLDSIISSPNIRTPSQVRFEAVLWLQAVQFIHNGRTIAPKRLLMIDDTQKLRKSQRTLLLDELVNIRPSIPIWVASRSIAFVDSFLSQGAREGRDIRDYPLEELWGGRSGQQFAAFAQNILDRRFAQQTTVPAGSFAQYLSDNLNSSEIEEAYAQAKAIFESNMNRLRDNLRYREWLARASQRPSSINPQALTDLYITRILVARDEANKQLSFELVPLSEDELDERDSSSVQSAAEIFIHREVKLPYYYGVDRLCAMATNNPEELLNLAAALYEGMKAKQVLRRQTQPQLQPREQEKRLRDAASKKRDFIPQSHSEGTLAQRLLDAIGVFCREKTYSINAPYAPGVTGVRLSNSEISRLKRTPDSSDFLFGTLRQVLFECVAENLLVPRESSASTSREGGTVFYLNRTLCAHYDLPLQYGGWQDTSAQALVEWMEFGLQPSRGLGLEVA